MLLSKSIRLIPFALAGGAAFFADVPASWATGEALLVSVAPLAEGAAFERIPDVELTVASDSLLFIGVASTLESGNKEIAVAEEQDAAVEPLGGEKLAVPSPHLLSLAPGFYSERVTVTAWDSLLDEAVVQAALRYFEVTQQGIVAISSGKYSDAVEPASPGLDRFGKAILVQAGTGRGIVPVLPKVLQFNPPLEEPVQPPPRDPDDTGTDRVGAEVAP